MIVEAENITTLVQRVQGFLDRGWTVTGGLVVITTRHDYTGDVKNKYAQALTKHSHSTTENSNIQHLSPADTQLLNALKEKRMELANQIGAPAYCIATNRSLENIVERKPTTLDELKTVFGFGPQKVERYGDALIEVVRRCVSIPIGGRPSVTIKL